MGAGEITLNAPLYDAEGTQTYTFRDFRYMLDFSGFDKLSKFELAEVELQCNGLCSAVRLAPNGLTFALRDCFVSRPKDRGVTSIGDGCQGMLIDNCQFLSDEDALDVSSRVSIALNTNANDIKLRNNRATRFLHFAVMDGANNVIIGNHFFQGDSVAGGVRSAGLVLSKSFTSSSFTGNYVDNCFIEWTNEKNEAPEFVSGFSFGALSVTDNVFLSGDVASWFSYLVVKPYGAGHFLNGLTITGNKFRSTNGSIDRAERVDTSFADLDHTRNKDVACFANSYHQVSAQVSNPVRLRHFEATAAQNWTIDLAGVLPFGGLANKVDSIVALGAVKNAGGAAVHSAPYVITLQGAEQDQVQLVWPEPVEGEVAVTVRMDE